ncbi:MAG: hypothetical protein VX537_07205 [Candidatus Neomarinimicrobiota bacterium]|nr:hypothetical protein [Candidatus Neomarinimicrobiota bacterium]
MNTRTITGFILSTFILCCSDREPLNPLDPNNPNTAGKPTGLNLVPIQKAVKISWDPVNVTGILYYSIFRKETGQTSILIGNVSAELTSYLDTSVHYYESYTYRVQVQTETYISPLSDSETITIGPYNIYVTDFWDSSIRIVSWDGNYTIASYPLYSPRDICLRNEDNRFCVADYYDKKLRLLTPSLEHMESIDLPDYPLDLDVDQDEGIVYIATRNGLLLSINSNQEILEERSLGMGLSWNTQLSFDPKIRGCWISVPDSNFVLYIAENGSTNNIKIINGFNYPTAIQTAGAAWVADSTGLYNVTHLGELDTILVNMLITDVAIDTMNNRCYFSGYNYPEQSWQAGNIDMNTFVKTILVDDEKSYLYNIFPIPDEKTGGFLIQQAYTWKLLRYDGMGTLIGESAGFNSRLSFQIY